jgi:small GTP-binding protein
MREISKKICLLGDAAVGKTSLVRRFVYDLFDDRYISTIGVKVSRKTITFSKNDELIKVTLMVWDLAGSEEFDQVRASYIRGAAGAILVCDLTQTETLYNLRSYADNLFHNDPNSRLILAANKFDLTDRQLLTLAQIEEMANGLKAPYYLTSAKTGEQVETLFRHLGQLLVI